MYSFIQSSVFESWLAGLKDRTAKARILARLKSAAFGNFGDCKPIGEGLSEMRVHVGAGYRVYYMRKGQTVYLLLMGGSKSTQKKDIEKALKLAKEFKEGKQ